MFRLLCVVLFCLSVVNSLAQNVYHGSYVSEHFVHGSFPLKTDDVMSSLLVSSNEYPGVIKALTDLQEDIYKVTGIKPDLFQDRVTGVCPVVMVGTIGQSSLIDELVSKKIIQTNDLKGKWEKYIIKTVTNPMPGVESALIIAGSDKRGTIFGIYDLSEQLGVSPWHWWADVAVKKKKRVYVGPCTYTQGEPAVKYRGIFINDENPCMQRWAKEKFGGMNSKMYSHLFELILRLRGNCLWPAMWGSFLEHKPLIPILKDENGNYLGNSFNEDDPENPRLADEYGIVIGTSHHEPMQRSQQEWIRNKDKYGNGHWNYMTNKEGIKQFFREGIEKTQNYESLITLGMRGEEDAPMVDAGSADANFRILEGIMKDQRKIIADATRKSSARMQQVWTLYSEVLDFYDQGMNVPDDVIIMLCDNNWGDVRRLPDLNKPKHTGGYGMYYHVGYYGAPRACKWLNVTQIQQMWEQLYLTYTYGVDKIWMLNVGDLKPNEFPMDFFMRMAWNPKAFNETNLDVYTQEFCSQQFGISVANEAARILELYCKYASRVIPEMLNEKTYNFESGEFKQVRDEFLALEARTLRLFLTVESDYRDAFKQLILFPVQALANLYDMYYALAMNHKLATIGDLAANDWADQVESCFHRDSVLTADYHSKIANGKWNYMMAQPHIGYQSWHGPEFNTMPNVKRVKSTDIKYGGYHFKSKNGVVVMEGEHYYKGQATDDTRWSVIPNMGRTLSGITLMPYVFNTEKAVLSYKMQLDTRVDSVKIYLFFDSTMPFLDGGHHVAIGFDGGSEISWNINHDLTWRNNYSKMYPAGAARLIETVAQLALPYSSDGVYQLTYRPLDPGIVLYKIVVDIGGYEQTYLKMQESPYWRE